MAPSARLRDDGATVAERSTKVQCSPLRLASSIPHPDGLCLACSSSLSPSPLFLLNVVFRCLWYLVESRTSETPVPSGYPMVPADGIRGAERKDAPRVEQLARRHAPVSAEPRCRSSTGLFPYASCTSSGLLIATEGTKCAATIKTDQWGVERRPRQSAAQRPCLENHIPTKQSEMDLFPSSDSCGPLGHFSFALK